MKKTVVFSTIAAVIAFVALAAFVVSSGFATAATKPLKNDESFKVSVNFTSETIIDLHPKGYSIGDLYASSDPIYRDGKKVGYDSWSCVLTNPDLDLFGNCNVTIVLPEGQIVVAGASNDSPDFTNAIVGGTGKYRHASGEMRYHETGDDSAEYTFYIRY